MIDPTRLAAIKALTPQIANPNLYTVEREDSDELLDDSGNGGFSVWLSHPEAQDALDSEEASRPEDSWKVVRYIRETPAMHAAADPEYGLQALAAEVERLQEEIRFVAGGSKHLVRCGCLGCLTDDCDHWSRDCSVSEMTLCRIGRAIDR